MCVFVGACRVSAAAGNGNGNSGAGWADRLAAWLTAQSFNNVLLVAILASVIGGMYYAMKEAIPAHLKTIQEGYDRLDEAHRSDRKESELLHTEQTKTIVGGFEKAADRNLELIKDLINSRKNGKE